MTREPYPARHGRPRTPWPGEQPTRAWGRALVALVGLAVALSIGFSIAVVLFGPALARWVQP